MGNLLAKEKLTEKQLQILASEYEGKKKSKTVLWLLSLFTGELGGHRYYLGDIGHGIAMTLTLRGIGIWAFTYFLIPIIGAIWLLIVLCTDSNPGENTYGPNPKVSSLGDML